MRASRAALAMLLAATVGCGQADERDAVRVTTERFLAAHEAGDGQAACATLSQETRTELESQERRPCEEAVGELELEGGAIDRVQVTVTNAKADLAGGESVFLSEEAAGWRISALGCTPQGAPASEPFDCELEA